jgi:DNA-binding CsgD family transcriptional regulator
MLTKREFEITEHLVYYGTKKETAPILGITERTLETHTKNIFRKLGITKLNELVLWYCGEKFNIKEKIASTKKEICIGTICLILSFSISIDYNLIIRNRNFRRDPGLEIYDLIL